MDFDDRSYLIEMGGSAVASFALESLHDIRCYYEAMEAFLASSSEERRFSLRGMRERLDPDIGEFLLNAENSLLWEDYFPSELRASVLVSIMSFFERYLNGVCTESSVLLRTQISHKTLKGSAIERAQTFLFRLCALPKPHEDRWRSMKRLQHLRNTVVHNGGLLETDRELANAQRLAAEMKGVNCSELGIDLEPEFIPYAINEVSQFLEEMSQALTVACERVKQFDHEA